MPGISPRARDALAALVPTWGRTDPFNETVFAINSSFFDESFDQLKDAKKSLDLSRKIIEMQEDTLQKDLKKQMKEISNSLDSLSNLFMDPEGLKGIQRNPNTLNNRLWTARRYLESSWTIPGQNAMKAVTNAREEAEETIKAVNEFIQVDYLLFQKTINGLRVKIFKEMQPVKIE